MNVQPFNPFSDAAHDNVYGLNVRGSSANPRGPRMSAFMLAIMTVIGLSLLQIAPAAAGEILEIPQVVNTPPVPVHSHKAHSRHHRAQDSYNTIATSTGDADWTNVTPRDATAPPDSGPTKVAANTESYPPDPNVGSINDYQNQPGEDGQPPTIPMGSGGVRVEPQGSMTTNLILGGILVGMMALEIASSHHHHR
jgi:hypothetical protein